MFSYAYPVWKMYRYKPLAWGNGRMKETEFSLSKFGMLITNESTLAGNLLEILKEGIEANDILKDRLFPGKGGQLVRAAGTSAKILAKEDAAQAIKSAKGVAFDPRYKGGNMTGAVNVINKIGKKQGIKNLADHPEVSSALKRANESRKNDAVEDIENVKKMNESYKTTFNSALDKYNIKSPSELDEGKRKEFFNYVDQQFKKGEL